MAHYDLKTSQLRDYVGVLKAGDTVSLTGTVYTARDAAHKKILAALENGEQVPFDIQDSVVYYAGPTPAKPGQVIGSCGPTTSGRMDPFSPTLIEKGQVCMIGKGVRNQNMMQCRNMAVCIWWQSAARALSLRTPSSPSKSLPMTSWAASRSSA